ncbi:MAG: TRAM domain-containing protein [Lentisphaeria bacterium]
MDRERTEGRAAAVEITDLALGGAGVGRLPDGRAVFVPFTLPGERAEIAITAEHARFCRGELRNLLTASPERVAPACPLFGRCGGCQYQHAAYPAQLRAKQRQLRETLLRLGGRSDLPAEIPAVAAPEPFGYRNKLRLEPAARGREFGFYALDNRTLLPVEACPLAMPALNAFLPEARRAALAQMRTPQPLTLRQPASGDPAWYLGPGPRAGGALLEERILGRPARVPLAGFWQVNPGVASRLLETVRGWLAAAPGGTLVDAYAGAGAFALALGEGAAQRVVIEADAAAVAAARLNLDAWGLAKGTEFLAAPAEAALPRTLRSPHPRPLTVVLDPPRGGCDPRLFRALAAAHVERLVYVSCNPATLARDLKALGPAWRLRRLALFDLFPQTAHFEAAAECVPATRGSPD